MAETQLASMFIGSTDDGDDIDRGRPSGAGNMIHIVNPQTSEILDYITLDNIIDDTHKKSLESYIETYDAIVLGGEDFSYDKHLEKRNHIIIPDEDGTYQEFILFEVDKYRDTEGRKTHFYAHATYLELKKAKVIYPTRREGLTLSQHAGWALNDTGWTVGIVEAEGTRTFTIENHTNPYEFIKRLANEFGVEIRFRVEHDGRRITARYVDFLERIGDWKGREVEFGRDLDSIRRIEKQDIVTALLGLGPERDDGTRIEVLVEDEEALQRWGRVDEHGNLHHLIEPYEIQSDRQEMTEEEARRYTRTALDKRINTQVTYETTILDLEEVPGLEHEKIRFGDTIRIKDTYFNPPLYLEARVFEIERSIKNKAKKDIKLGDYIEYTEEEVHAIWRQLQEQIRQKISRAELVEYAERKVQRDTIPPEDTEHLWLDTSTEPNVLKRYDEVKADWVKATPTEADEVGAETPEGAQQKADEAKQEAISYSENFTINYAQKQITSSTTPPANPEIGDLWFDSSTQPPTFRRWNGSEWEKLSATTFEELEGMINKDQLPDRVIDSMKLAIDAVQEENLSEDSVYAEAIQAEAVGAQAIAANAILAKHIAAGEVTANHLAADAVTADAIAAGAILAEHISANSITANHIKSLVGLNVNDQFIVDSQGNVSFAGHLEGASGTFKGVVQGGEIIQRSGDNYIKLSDRKLESVVYSQPTNLTQGVEIFTNNIVLYTHSGKPNTTTKVTGINLDSRGFSFKFDPESQYFDEAGIYGTYDPFNNETHLALDFNRVYIIGDIRVETGNIWGKGLWDITTSNAANARIGNPGSGGYSRFLRSTSSKRYKMFIEDADVDPYRILNLKPKSWIDKGEYERNGNSTEGLTRYYGIIAEDMEEIGLPEYVEYVDGKVENIVERAWTLLIPIVRDLNDEVKKLKERLERLENEGN